MFFKKRQKMARNKLYMKQEFYGLLRGFNIPNIT
jgi:hypothetical protein